MACGKCKVIMTRIGTRLADLEKKVEGVISDVEQVMAHQESTANEREEMKEKTVVMETKIATNMNNVKAETMNEAEQRLSRRKNVVMYGVPESAAATQTERIAHDKRGLGKARNIIGASQKIKEDGVKSYASG